MNERMIELANKANEEIGYTFKLEDAKQLHELMEKFAELIVRECTRIADIADENKCEWIGGNILTHFGVEERKPCKSPYCECDIGKCSHTGFYDARGES